MRADTIGRQCGQDILLATIRTVSTFRWGSEKQLLIWETKSHQTCSERQFSVSVEKRRKKPGVIFLVYNLYKKYWNYDRMRVTFISKLLSCGNRKESYHIEKQQQTKKNIEKTNKSFIIQLFYISNEYKLIFLYLFGYTDYLHFATTR